tara:strand:- start:468 stop:914 length:447 start_codon:yes stop_codon:yes gene_type:complete
MIYLNSSNQKSMINIEYSWTYFRFSNFRLILLFLTSLILLAAQQVKSEELSLKCIGKFEINRGELIKPDWEISYLTINLDGLKSTILDNGIKKEGRTLIRRNYYTITHRDNSYRIKATYKIDQTHGTYMVNYPQRNRTLVGICEKGRG